MQNNQIVVRIIQPSIKPHIKEHDQINLNAASFGERLVQRIFRMFGWSLVAMLIVYFTVSFFNLGFSYNDIAVIVGLPLSVGLVASYVIL
ncbi:MAG: hypothetical protein WCV91_05980 [Candidatus Margulisiibacteriota bacterium]